MILTQGYSSGARCWNGIRQRNSLTIKSELIYFTFSFTILVIFVTAAGNVLVCLAIARERKLQNTTNYFLMSLAIADCLVAILVMPMGMISEIIGKFFSATSSIESC